MYIAVVLTISGKRNKKIDTTVGKPNTVLCEIYLSVVTKYQLSKTIKLSVFILCSDLHLRNPGQ